MAALDLTGIESALTGLVPSTNDILQSIAVSAASGVILSGLKNQIGTGALDPLGLFNKAAPANNPNAVTGPTASASAFAAMPPAAQAAFLAAGGHIVNG